MKTINGEKNSIPQEFLNEVSDSIKKHYPLIILMAVGFIAVSLLNFFSMSMSQTVASYRLEEFEIGQVADRTIIAPKSFPADEINPISIESGEKIIRKGFQISGEAYSKLQKMAESPVYLDYRFFANTELYLALLCAMWFILYAFVPFSRKLQLREFIMQAVCFLCVYAAVAFGSKQPFFSSEFSVLIIIPASLFILLEAILYGQLSAVFFSFVLSLGVFSAAGYQAVPFIFTLASCLSASTIVRKIEHRIDMVLVSIVLAFVDSVIVVILAVIFNAHFAFLPKIIPGVALNGFISGILALGLLTPVEFMLNTASVFRLMDLSDLNNSIMRKMLLTASGTYQHSQMVAQLAENACRSIGANALLARVGAYYHDIGKLDQSEYFTENQFDGINPHDEMKPSLSASVLRSHVRKGIEKARQLHMPLPVIDIINEHHGNSLISYFYNKAKELDPNVNEVDFMYTGVPPTTRESAVVMLADTVEAACKSIKNPTEEKIQNFITNLINVKIEHHQLDNCGLTFKDITKIKEEFFTILAGFYHSRIEYPNQKAMEKPAEAVKDPTETDVSLVKTQRKKKDPTLEVKLGVK